MKKLSSPRRQQTVVGLRKSYCWSAAVRFTTGKANRPWKPLYYYGGNLLAGTSIYDRELAEKLVCDILGKTREEITFVETTYESLESFTEAYV